MTVPAQPAATSPGQEQTPALVTTPQGEAQEKQQAPQYVTKEELGQITEEILRRAKQSDRDRAKQINDELLEIKTLVTKTGVQITPEQEAKLREELTDKIDAELPTQGQSAAPTASQPAPVDKFLADVFAEAGTQVTPNDPEWKDLQAVLDKTWNDPQGLPKVLVAATKAATAKAARTAAMQETAAARVGGGGSQITGNVSATTGLQMLEQAYKK